MPLAARLTQIFKSGMSTPYKVLRALIQLSDMLDHDPDFLRQQLPQAKTKVPSKTRGASIDRIVGEVEDSGSGEGVQAPPTASQVYHASLLNGNNLDDVLTGFIENKDGDQVSTSEHD